ncbi:MAG: hypothetical protein JO296_13570 [Pseudonocardiales bacterium]|nr:hypothetical protein [Pseudonocardiales bacterium]
MTEQDRPSEQDPKERDGQPGTGDLGGPGAALGSGVEDTLTGEQPREDDEGKASTSPEPTG